MVLNIVSTSVNLKVAMEMVGPLIGIHTGVCGKRIYNKVDTSRLLMNWAKCNCQDLLDYETFMNKVAHSLKKSFRSSKEHCEFLKS